jgi:predicted nucleic acid-binding protein
MANSYLDSSALVKYYHTEAGSADVLRFVEDPTVRSFISRLTATEIHSAFALKLRTGEIDDREFDRIWKRFEDDVTQRRFEVVRILEAHHDEAERLLRKYARRTLRTLDALQLAVAIDLNRRTTLAWFLCSDTRLCEIAQEEGLSVFNPIQP